MHAASLGRGPSADQRAAHEGHPRAQRGGRSIPTGRVEADDGQGDAALDGRVGRRGGLRFLLAERISNSVGTVSRVLWGLLCLFSSWS